MFSLPPARSGHEGTDAGSRDRSRTPGSYAAAAWTTGNHVCDEWFAKQSIAPDVVQNFGMLPQRNRKTIILGMMDRMPDNIEAWICGCIKNWRLGDLERRLTGSATPQRPNQNSFVPHEVPPTSRDARVISPTQQATQLAPAGVPAEACKALAKHWPDDKSTLIGEVMGFLDETTTDKYLEQDAPEQGALAFAFMLTAPANTAEWSAHMNALLDRYVCLRGQAPAELAPLSRTPRNEGAAIDVQFVLGGFSTVMAATLITVLKRSIPMMHARISWTFQPVLFLRDGTPAEDTISTETLNETQVDFDATVENFKTLQENFETLSEKWRASGTKFVFMANVACASHPDMSIDDIPKNYLHQAPNKWSWTFLQASHVVRQHFRDDVVADIMFAPPTAALQNELNEMWGEETTVSAPASGAVSPVIPRVHSTPAKFGVTPCLETAEGSDSSTGREPPLDLTPLLQAQPNFRVRPSLISKLAVTRTFKERQLTRDEAAVLEAFKTDTGVTNCLAGRAYFLHRFGLRDTVAETLLEKEYPCFISVVRSTGTRAGTGSKFGTPCGQERYCKQCEKVFAMLDRGYGLQTLGDVVLAMITKSVPSWTGRCQPGTEWQRNEVACKPHECGDECTGVR